MLSFLKGAELEKYYNHTWNCFDSHALMRDDWFYYKQLGLLVEFDDSTDPPIVRTPGFQNKTLNFTKFLGTNFADTLPNCFRAGLSIQYFERMRWKTYDNSTA